MKWRLFFVAFWVFVAVMLAKQAYDYNNQVTAYQQAHPEKHYFYDPGAPAQAAAPKASAPDIRQTNYQIIPSSPANGSFTVQFTVKNVGTVAATNIQVEVKPYRGMLSGDGDNGNDRANGPGGGEGPVSDNDPAVQLGEWVSVPDLAPGQSYTSSTVFVAQPGMTPNGDNPKLDIIFEPVKSK